MLKSNLCDYSESYILKKDTIDLLAAAALENDKAQKKIAFKNNARFRLRTSKVYSTLIDNAEDFNRQCRRS